ncbi:hypothetical protein CPB86DRAFT_696003, partial [Serendipita vermifera]
MPGRLSNEKTSTCIPAEISDPQTYIIDKYALNQEQSQAFRLIVEHSSDSRRGIAPLRLYLGGMGGTGKSRVIQSLCEYFKATHQSKCFAVLAPTGSAACLINGSTYHSFLGLGVGTTRKPTLALRNKLKSIHTVFLDEISMVSCLDLWKISSRL